MPQLVIDPRKSDLITAYLLRQRQPLPEPIAPKVASPQQWALLFEQAAIVVITVAFATVAHMPRELVNAVTARRRYPNVSNWSN